MSEDKVAVYVSRDLYDEVERRVQESGGEFKSVEDYVNFVLREVVKEESEEKEETYTKEEEEEIKKRLKSLGYL